jgi:hypothetical protein
MRKLLASISKATPRLSENLTYFLDAEAVVFCAFIARYCATALGIV